MKNIGMKKKYWIPVVGIYFVMKEVPVIKHKWSLRLWPAYQSVCLLTSLVGLAWLI